MKQLAIYFGLSMLISWLIWFPLYGNVFGFSGLPVLSFNHAIGALGPLIASVLTTFIFSGRSGVKNLLRNTATTGSVLHLLLALLSPFILLLMAIGLDHVISNSAVSFTALMQVKEFPQFSIYLFFIYNLVFFGFGEEVGWRGFALPRLQRKTNAFWASIILSVFWAIWHVPLFLYRPGYTEMDFAGIAGWFFSLLTGSILMTWLYNSSKGSILVCAIFHTTIDLAFTANTAGTEVVNYLGILITLGGIAVVLIFKPARLSLQEKFTGQMQ